MQRPMPEEKSLGSKLLGLFVEKEAGDGAAEEPAKQGKSAADMVAELARGSAQAENAPVAPPPRPIPVPTGPIAPAQVDFDGVFKDAGMDAAELERVRKAEELLKSLPESTPKDVKRQIVEASLKAFGFETAKIIGAANNQLKALETYVRLNGQQTAKAISEHEKTIRELEDKVISLKADITRKTEQLAAVTKAAELRTGQVKQVLDFFVVAAPPPPAAPPKP
jgi:hypothetical protein